MPFTIQMSEEEFRILGPEGEEGCAVEYGEVATLAIGPAIYYAEAQSADEKPNVMRVATCKPMPTMVEEVEFEEEEEDAAAGPVLVEAETENSPEVVE
jgi:hypothetical protein